MADNYLITGYWGEPHVTAENDRGFNAAVFGAGKFVLPVGEMFRAEYIGNNTVRVYDGKLIDNGALAGIPAGEYIDLLIPEAGQGMNRNDLIVFQYSQDASTLIESGVFVVLSGTETSETAVDPDLTESDLLTNKATFDQMVLWRVPVSGTVISDPVQVFEEHGLTNVDNTPDTEKYVKYAQTAGEAEKVGNGLTVRFNGGRTENTDMWIFDGSTSRTVNITPDKIGAAPAGDYATEAFVTNKIAEAQLDGSGDVDLSGYATKDDLTSIDYPVDSVNGKTGAVQLSASDVGAIAATSTSLTNQSVKAWAASLTSSAWAYTNDTTTDMPAEVSASSNYAIVTANVTASGGWIELHLRYLLNGGEAVCIYNYGWGEWEWITPPMSTGVEYRTTERYKGKPVYVKILPNEAAPSSATSKTISLNVTNFSEDAGTYLMWVTPSYSIRGMVYHTSGTVEAYAWVNISSASVTINRVKTSVDSMTATIVAKYTKTTD